MLYNSTTSYLNLNATSKLTSPPNFYSVDLLNFIFHLSSCELKVASLNLPSPPPSPLACYFFYLPWVRDTRS